MANIPKFKNKAQFLRWWRQLSDQQAVEFSQEPVVQKWIKKCWELPETREELVTIARKTGIVIKRKANKIIVEKTENLELPELLSFCPDTLKIEITGVKEVSSQLSYRYMDQKLLGEGGMGRVILSIDTMFHRPVARKFSLNPEFVEQFLREAKITGYLDHPNIVPVHEIGEENGEIYFSMKAIQGRDLETAIKENHKKGFNKQMLNDMLQIFLKICDAISYAHSKNIIHRDIKPANVMVGEFGEVYVTDWGLAKHLAEEDQNGIFALSGEKVYQTLEKGEVKGSPHYMPPEQADGKADKRSDIYALGALLYEILTGRKFRKFRKGISQVEALVTIIKSNGFVNFIPPRKLNPKIPPPLESIVLKAVQSAPEERYQSVEDLKQDIKAFLLGEKVSVHNYSLTEKISMWISKHKTLSTASAVALLVGLVGLGAYSVIYARAKNLELKVEREEKARLLAEAKLSKTLKERLREKEEQLKRAKRRAEAQKLYWQAEEIAGDLLVQRRGGNLEKAIELLTKAIEIDPEYADAYFKRGLAKYSLWDFRGAFFDMLKANEISEKLNKELDVKALYYAGLIQLDYGANPQKAGWFFQKIIKYSKDNKNSYVLLAKSVHEYLKGNFEKATGLVRKALKMTPNLWEGWYILAAFHFGGLGGIVWDRPPDEDQALKYLDKALKINPFQLRCLFLRARIHASKRNEKLMHKDLERILQRFSPNRIEGYFIKSTVLFDGGKFKDVIETVNGVEKRRIYSLEKLLKFRGASYYHLWDKTQENTFLHRAKEDLEKAIKLGVKHWLNYFYLGRVLRELGDYENALKCFDETFKHYLPRFEYGRIHHEKGITFFKKRDFEKAKEELELAYRIGVPANSGIYADLGATYFKLKNFKDAKIFLKKHLATKDHYFRGETYLILGAIYAMENELSKAVQMYESYLGEGYTKEKGKVLDTLKELKILLQPRNSESK